MNAEKLGLRIEKKNLTDGDGGFLGTAHFFSEGVKFPGGDGPAVSDEPLNDVPRVSLSRIPDHCYTRIDALQMHNGHAPGFHSETERDAYVERVKKDVEDAAEAYDGETLTLPEPPQNPGLN